MTTPAPDDAASGGRRDGAASGGRRDGAASGDRREGAAAGPGDGAAAGPGDGAAAGPGDAAAAGPGDAAGGGTSDGASDASAGAGGEAVAAASEEESLRRSGLRNPEAAVRGLGAGTLVLEAIVLLLAIQPIRILGGDLGGWGIGVVVALAVLCVAIAGSMKRRWAWHAGTAVQVMLLAGGLLHWSLAALGLVFGAAWAYATHVRRTILG